MPKVIAIVAFASEVVKFYCKQLNELFGELIKVKTYSFEDNNINKIVHADMFLISTYSIYQAIKKIFLTKVKL